MTEEGSKLQEQHIKTSYDFLKEEKIIISKDVALNWIYTIALGYDGAEDIGSLRAVIDELAAYALLGKECPE